MNAFRECDIFSGHVETGKQGIDRNHRKLVVETSSVKVTTSLNFDVAVDGLLMKNKRWDYFLETSAAPGKLHALEVHRFNQRELMGKKEGTLAIMRDLCPAAIAEVSSWNVIAHGNLPRKDLIARFSAETRIRIRRDLPISQV
ncbi:MAG: hypothetical protein ACK5OI_07965 [Curvibacter sp.]|nr:hypothetical protein [Curvibacter sp.]